MSKASIYSTALTNRGQRLRYSRKFMSIPGQSGDTLHLRLVQDQHHEDIIGNFPFALDFILARRSESESRIVLCVAHDNDEWIACIFDFPIPRFDQFSANSPVAGIPALRPSDPKATPLTLSATGERAVHDMSRHLTVHCRN
jgi:hypothetical protein